MQRAQTLSRPTAKVAPFGKFAAAAQPDDKALLGACAELAKTEAKVRRKPTLEDYDRIRLLRGLIASTQPETARGEQARAEALAVKVPTFPMTGTNAELDAMIGAIRVMVRTQEENGRAHSEAEEAARTDGKAGAAERRAERVYLASRGKLDRALFDILATRPNTLAEASVKLHAYAFATVLQGTQYRQWKALDLPQSLQALSALNYDAQLAAPALAAYAADVARLTETPGTGADVVRPVMAELEAEFDRRYAAELAVESTATDEELDATDAYTAEIVHLIKAQPITCLADVRAKAKTIVWGAGSGLEDALKHFNRGSGDELVCDLLRRLCGVEQTASPIGGR